MARWDDRYEHAADYGHSWLRYLPDLVALAADDGRPIVLELADEPPAHVHLLMRTLGVPVRVRPRTGEGGAEDAVQG